MLPLLKHLNGNDMRLIRLAVFSIVILFILASLVGAMFPSTVLVSRAINIAAHKENVMPHVADIGQWKEWIEGMDKAEVKIYSPRKADIGTTAVTIQSITDSTVISDWRGAKGSSQISTIRLIGDSSQNITVVQWQFE